MELLSLLLTLRPEGSPPAGQLLPTWWGRAAHALLLHVIDQYEPALASRLHPGGEDSSGPRPFSASTLIGRFPRGGFDPQAPYTLRLTALQADVAALLLQAARTGPLAPGSRVELDYLPFRVESNNAEPAAAEPAAAEPQPGSAAQLWAGQDTYANLSARLLLAKDPAPRRIALQFTSPTTFKSGGKHMPLPLPELVFGSLLERWNTFAPIAFPPEARRYAAEVLAVGRYRLSSRSVALKGSGLRTGAVGEASYVSLSYDRYWMSVIGVLAAFARYSGVGAGVTMGLGQCRQVEAMEREDG